MAVTSRNVLHGEQLRHGRQAPDVAAVAAGPRRLVHQHLGAVDGGDAVGQVVGDGLERAERLVELLAVLGVLRR